MQRMDTAKLLIPGVAALALSHSIEEQQPACGVEPLKAASCVMACPEQHPTTFHLEPGHVGPHPNNAIPGIAIPGRAIPGVGYYG
jgi:hypothetical protein